MVKKHHADKVLAAANSSSQAALSSLIASWRRSLVRHNLDPSRRFSDAFVTSSELNVLRARNELLLAVAQPVLDRMFRSASQAGCCVALTDRNGIILDQRAAMQDKTDFANIGMAEGGCWSEARVGTNGIGTCLYEDQPVTIYRDQHFAVQNINISCMDAPIYDPHGRLVAALDISNCRDDFTSAMAGMTSALVLDAARHIECAYFRRYFSSARVVLLDENAKSGVAMLAIDHDDIVMGATRGARGLLNITDKTLAEGQTLDQLVGQGTEPSFSDAERTVLRQAMARTGGNASKAARLLGIGRATLYRRMARAGFSYSS